MKTVPTTPTDLRLEWFKLWLGAARLVLFTILVIFLLTTDHGGCAMRLAQWDADETPPAWARTETTDAD